MTPFPFLLLVLCLFGLNGCAQKNSVIEDSTSPKGMELVWSDDFNYPNAQLDAGWISQNGPNTHILCSRWLEFEFNANKTIGCIQFVNGWLSGDTWNSVIDNYKIQYFNGTSWVDIATFDASQNGLNLGKEYHTYALEWSKDSLIYSFDGKVMRRAKNEFCHSPAPVYLSEAIISWAGAVSDAIDGTSMDVDWVKVYQFK